MSPDVRALIGCLVVGLFAPVIGTLLVQKRLSLMGDGIGHVAFAGIGAGLLFGVWPVGTALLFAVAGAVGVEMLRARRRASGDLALALFFYAGIALGAVFASRNGNLDPETLPYLFGDPLKITASGLTTIIAVGTVVVAAVWTGRRLLFAIVSDEGWSRAQGLPVNLANLVLAGMAAAVVVAGMRIVGLLLVAALLVMPVASAQLLARSFRTTMLLAAAIGAVCAVAGLGLGLALDVSPGGAIVLLASAVFAGTTMVTHRAPRTLRQEEHG